MAEPYVNPAELPVKRRENIALGVLGALLFSAAGGLVHFGLLQLGYIAWISALVGMAAGYFGYGLFSGRKNTVHGAILAVVFTMLMIVAAEYFGLAKEIFDALTETYDIAFRDALASVPDFLTEAEIREMRETAERLREEDKKKVELMMIMNEIQEMVQKVKQGVEANQEQMDDDFKESFNQFLGEIRELKKKRMEVTKEELEETKSVCQQWIDAVYGEAQ